MTDVVSVRKVTFTAATTADQSQGLLGFLTLVLADAVILDGLTLRRTREGQLRVSFPTRTDARGNKHPIVRPIDAAARATIEAQILAALAKEHPQP